jgi:hypothetical protein
MGLMQRATQGAARAEPLAAAGPTAIEPVLLASGVYIGGSEALLPGCRYALVRHGRALQILGPLDSSPGVIRVDHLMRSIALSSVGERVVISDLGSSKPPFVAAFSSLAGIAPEELERRLTAPEAAPAQNSAGFLN